MIQMRWFVPVDRDTVLQYRQMEDTTVYAGMQPALPPAASIMQWSKWTDVPLVSERNPDHP